jgi:O-antigen/teichoic acid export membrane protein
LPLQGNDILTYISDKLDILIVGAFLRPTAVGYLGIAKKIPENLQRVSNSLHTVYFPHMCNLFSEGQKSKAEEVMNRFLRLTSFIAAFGALIVVLFQRDIITLVFSEKYIPSAPAFGLLMVIFILIVASTILDYTLVAAGHPDYLPIISLADTGPSLLANLVLIPIFGFMGAVYAKLIANILTNPVSVWALLREKIGVRLSTYLKPIFLLLICLAVYFGLGWDTVVVKGFLIVLFVVLSAFFSLVTKRDISGLLKVLTLRFPKTVVNK